MTHPAYLLARLNPKNARFDIGPGGVPELTQADIAAGIALVPAGLGRELLCRIWWHDGAELSDADLDKLLADAQLTEWRDRMDALLSAQIAVAYAEGQSLNQRQRAGNMLDAARSRMWPRIGPGSCYADIRRAVLVELSTRFLCDACHGRGLVMQQAKVVACSTCAGSGRGKVSDRARAEAIGRDESTYRSTWRPVYDWTMHLCQDLVEPAQWQFAAALA